MSGTIVLLAAAIASTSRPVRPTVRSSSGA